MREEVALVHLFMTINLRLSSGRCGMLYNGLVELDSVNVVLAHPRNRNRKRRRKFRDKQSLIAISKANYERLMKEG